MKALWHGYVAGPLFGALWTVTMAVVTCIVVSFATGEGLAQSSAYRNLVVLEEVGIVTRIVTNDDFARYELAEHLTHHHHHLICSSCGDVTDFALDDKAEAGLDKALHKIADEVGFTVEAHRLDLVGTCSNCD